MATAGKPPASSELAGTHRSAPDGESVAPAGPGTVALLYLAVGLGSAIGGSLRWLLSDAMPVPFGADFPWGTLFVNVTGSFLIGLYAALAGPGGGLKSGPIQRHFFMTGVFGGYTTFSVFSLETIRLAEDGLLVAAGLNIAGSLVIWLAAVWVGFQLGGRISGSNRR